MTIVELTGRRLPSPAAAISRLSGWQAICDWSDLEPEWGEAALIKQWGEAALIKQWGEAALIKQWGEAARIGLGGSALQLAVFRTWDDQLYVVSNADPANGACVMSRGIVGSKGSRPTIASPLLKQVYDLGTGECFNDPSLRLPVYPSRVVHGQVLVGPENKPRSSPAIALATSSAIAGKERG